MNVSLWDYPLFSSQIRIFKNNNRVANIQQVLFLWERRSLSPGNAGHTLTSPFSLFVNSKVYNISFGELKAYNILFGGSKVNNILFGGSKVYTVFVKGAKCIAHLDLWHSANTTNRYWGNFYIDNIRNQFVGTFHGKPILACWCNWLESHSGKHCSRHASIIYSWQTTKGRSAPERRHQVIIVKNQQRKLTQKSWRHRVRKIDTGRSEKLTPESYKSLRQKVRKNWHQKVRKSWQ